MIFTNQELSAILRLAHAMANADGKITEEVIKEIEDCNKKIEAITGEKVKLLRAPSGDYDNKSIEIAESMNMKMRYMIFLV